SFAFLYLMVFCRMAAYVAYGYLIRHTSPIIASSCMYVNPIVAVALGALMLGEPVTTATVVATVAILGSVGLSFLFDPARRPAARAAADASPAAAGATVSATAAAATAESAAAAAPDQPAMPDPAPILAPSAVPLAVPAPGAVVDPAAVIDPAPAFTAPPAGEPAASRPDA
ncbi:EamA family transporter, partial [Burkholderia thailandensis]|uniref:EamA family transporter n=1 Tax=Burkholderia thailandensis TaxID=57975 RepID=UPI00217D355A